MHLIHHLLAKNGCQEPTSASIRCKDKTAGNITAACQQCAQRYQWLLLEQGTTTTLQSETTPQVPWFLSPDRSTNQPVVGAIANEYILYRVDKKVSSGDFTLAELAECNPKDSINIELP